MTYGVSPVIYYYHYDGLGSVVALSDNTGAIAERYTYDVFGKPNTMSALGNRFMFTGREYDNESSIGLYYYRARFYRPSIGRFLQADPIGMLPDGGEWNPFGPLIRYYDGMNLYRYVKNNPRNKIDPFGMGCRSYCVVLGIQGWAWGPAFGECQYVCTTYCFDERGRCSLIPKVNFKSVPGSYCPPRIVIDPDPPDLILPPGIIWA